MPFMASKGILKDSTESMGSGDFLVPFWSVKKTLAAETVGARSMDESF